MATNLRWGLGRVISAAALALPLWFAPAVQAGYIENFTAGPNGWLAPRVSDDGDVPMPAVTYNSGGFVSAAIDNGAHRLYGFQPSDTALYGDLTGLTLTVDTRTIGTVSNPTGPMARFYVGSSDDGSNYFVSNDVYSWNPNGDTAWTTHTVALAAVNFVEWPNAAAHSRTFAQVLAQASDIGLVFTGDSGHFNKNHDLGVSGMLGDMIEIDNFGTLSGLVGSQSDDGWLNGSSAGVPEPAVLALLLAGGALILGGRWTKVRGR